MKVIPLEDTRDAEGVPLVYIHSKPSVDCLIETVIRLKEYILRHPSIHDDKDKFIEGWGWDHTKWTDDTFPTSVGSLPSVLRVTR